jgi:hypothetical protein
MLVAQCLKQLGPLDNGWIHSWQMGMSLVLEDPSAREESVYVAHSLAESARNQTDGLTWRMAIQESDSFGLMALFGHCVVISLSLTLC